MEAKSLPFVKGEFYRRGEAVADRMHEEMEKASPSGNRE
jgi:hypothetical protein